MRKSDVVFFLSGAAALGYETAWARTSRYVRPERTWGDVSGT